MGVIEVEIRTLRGDRPIVFSWENPVKKVIQCVLVACPCQSITFPDTRGMPLNPDGTIMCNKDLACDLAVAMDKADLISHASLDNMESLLNRVNRLEKEELEAKEKKEQDRKERRRKARKERRRKRALEKKAVLEKFGRVKESSVAMLDEELHSELEQPFEEEGDDNTESQSAEEQSPLPDTSSSVPVETFEEGQVVTDYVEISSSGEHLPADDVTSKGLEAISAGQTTGPETRASSVDIVSLEKVGVISASATATSVVPLAAEDEDDTGGLIEAIQSIFKEYPEAKVVPSQESQAFNSGMENQSPFPREGEKVQFIRHLTEEERKKMFRFGSDIEKENRKKLEGAKAFLCDICGKIVTLPGKKKHMKTHDSDVERSHICNICGKAFVEKELLRRHIDTHDANRKFVCRYCPKSYRTVSGRTTHERRHFAVYREVCKLCDKKFVDAKSYKRHLFKVHGFECYREQSSSSGSRKAADRRDRPKRPPEKIHCQECNKLISKTNIKNHMYRHEGKMYTCDICGKVMAMATRYIHRKLHSKPRVACEVCGKRVLKMDVHMRTHTGEKPFKCRYCDRCFSAHGTRQVHEIKHTGERPHKCTICDKSWRDRNCYKIHMQKLHPGEPIQYKRPSTQINLTRRGTLGITPISSTAVMPAE